MPRIGGILLLCASLVAGCGVGAPNPSGSDSILTKGLNLPPGTNAILAVKSTSAKSSQDAGSLPTAQSIASVTLTTAMLVLEEIELETVAEAAADAESGDDDEGEGTEVELEGPFLIDLVNATVMNLGSSHIDDDADDDGVGDVEDDDDDSDGESDDADEDDDNDGVLDDEDQTVGETPLFDALDLPAGTYSSVEFKLSPLEADEAPAPDHPMIGLSVFVSGSINGVPFEYCGSFEEEMEFSSSNGIVVDDNALATFLLTFDPLGWFANVDPAEGTLSEDGVLRMCGGENAVSAEIVRQAIRERARLGSDEDGDGDDDDDEDGDLEDDEEDDGDDIDTSPDEVADSPTGE
ncbi:MAG: hypothetical protein Q7R41_12225 [Phycisphaerales bacterium]|nr:hypothetical protein [Phycisphaerales bacterium]